jgi:hypothetical protein
MIMTVFHFPNPAESVAITVCDEITNMVNTLANVNGKMRDAPADTP